MILDTTYFIHLIQRLPRAFEKGLELFEARTVRRVPVPVLFEVFYGVEFVESDEQRRRAKNAFMGYPRVDLDDELVRDAARRLAEADRAAGGDSGIDVNDAYVAAVAASYDEPVLTENVADFEALGVDVEPY